MSELKQAEEIINFYKYDMVDKENLKYAYGSAISDNNFVIDVKDSNFIYGVELIMLRINEASKDVEQLKKYMNKKENGQDRPRDILANIKHLEKTYKMVEDYSSTKDGEQLKKLLNRAISDLNTIVKRTKTTDSRIGSTNIRYGYGNNLEIFNHRIDYLQTTETHIKEAINKQINLLFTNLLTENITHNRIQIKNIFHRYFDIYYLND